MPTAVRETVLAAFFARLETIAGVGTHRMPSFELGPEDLPAVVQIDGGDEVDDDTSQLLNLRLRVTVVGAVAAASGEALGAAISDIRAKIRDAVAGDWTLGGTASIARYAGCADPVVVTDQTSAPYAAVALDFVVSYDEAELDAYSQTP